MRLMIAERMKSSIAKIFKNFSLGKSLFVHLSNFLVRIDILLFFVDIVMFLVEIIDSISTVLASATFNYSFRSLIKTF